MKKSLLSIVLLCFCLCDNIIYFSDEIQFNKNKYKYFIENIDNSDKNHLIIDINENKSIKKLSINEFDSEQESNILDKDNEKYHIDVHNNEDNNKNPLQFNQLKLEEGNLIKNKDKDNVLNEKSSNTILISIVLTSVVLLIVGIIISIRNNNHNSDDNEIEIDEIDEDIFTNDIVENIDNNNLMFEKCSVVLKKDQNLISFIKKINNQYFKNLFKNQDSSTCILEIYLIKHFNFNYINNDKLIELIQFLYNKMSSCNDKEIILEHFQVIGEMHNEESIYQLKKDQDQNIYEKYQDFYFKILSTPNDSYIQINILTKKQNTTNEYNQLLNIGYNFVDTIYFIEYFIDEDKNNSIKLYYNNYYLYYIYFKQNNTTIFYLYNPDKNNEENKWQLQLNKHIIIQNNITINYKKIQITYKFLKKISNIINIESIPIKTEFLQNLTIPLQEDIITQLKTMNIIGLDISNVYLQLKLLKNLDFENININNVELKKLIKYLYYIMSLDVQLNKNNFIKNFFVLVNKTIYQLKNKNKEYQQFYFQPYIKSNSIYINILIKKQDDTDLEYHQLLTIGYNFVYEKYLIKYCVQNNDHSIQICYNDKSLYQIDFIYNNIKKFYFYNLEPLLYNKQDRWQLKCIKYDIETNKNITEKIADNIYLYYIQIENKYKFLKEINNIINIKEISIEESSLINLNFQLQEQSIQILQGNINNKHIILPLITSLNFQKFNDQEINLEILEKLIKNLYSIMSLCKTKEDYKQFMRNNIRCNMTFGNNIYQLKDTENLYKDFYLKPYFNIKYKNIKINILIKKENSTNFEYNQLLTIGYNFYNNEKKYYSIKYITVNKNIITLYYNNNFLYKINYISNFFNKFYLYLKNKKSDIKEYQWKLYDKNKNKIQNDILLNTDNCELVFKFLKTLLQNDTQL